MGLLLYYLGIVSTYALGGLPSELVEQGPATLDAATTLALVVLPSAAMGYIGFALFTAPGLAGGTLLAAETLGFAGAVQSFTISSIISALLGLASYFHPLISKFFSFGKPDVKIFSISVLLATAVTAAALLT